MFTKILASCGLAALFFEGNARGITIVLGFAAAFAGNFLLYGLRGLRRQNFKTARSNVGQLKVKEWRVRNALFWASGVPELMDSKTHLPACQSKCTVSVFLHGWACWQQRKESTSPVAFWIAELRTIVA
eukprot:symbB.v1.2.037498.t1/scaffold5556.1/size26356/3